MACAEMSPKTPISAHAKNECWTIVKFHNRPTLLKMTCVEMSPEAPVTAQAILRVLKRRK